MSSASACQKCLKFQSTPFIKSYEIRNAPSIGFLQSNAEWCEECARPVQMPCNAQRADMQELVNKETPEQRAMGFGFKPKEIEDKWKNCVAPVKSSMAAAAMARGELGRRLATPEQIKALLPKVPNRPIKGAGMNQSHSSSRAAGASTPSFHNASAWKPHPLSCMF